MYLVGVVVETLQRFLSFLVFHLDDLEDLLDASEALLAGQIRRVTGLILESSIVLDLFAGIFDLGEAEGRRGTFQEVPVGTQVLEVSILPRTQELSDRLSQMKVAFDMHHKQVIE